MTWLPWVPEKPKAMIFQDSILYQRCQLPDYLNADAR